jgi:hypothetical protein
MPAIPVADQRQRFPKRPEGVSKLYYQAAYIFKVTQRGTSNTINHGDIHCGVLDPARFIRGMEHSPLEKDAGAVSFPADTAAALLVHSTGAFFSDLEPP